MDELLSQFLIEGPELLHQATDDLLALEHTPGDAETLNSAFRAIHTLKGSVAVFELTPMEAVLQVAEDLMMALRGGEAVADKPVIDALLQTIRQCEGWLDDLANQGELGAGAERLGAALTRSLQTTLSHTEAPSTQTPEVAPDISWAVALAARHGELVKGPVVAVKYTPDAQAYFNGDDPYAILRRAPDLLILDAHVKDIGPGAYDPFLCTLVFEVLYQAPVAAVRAALRLLGEQAVIVDLKAPDRAKDARPATAAQALRVDVVRIDALASLVGDLAVAKNALSIVAGQDQRSDLRDISDSIDRLTSSLHRQVMQMRMTPLAPVLRRLRPLARDIADSLGKDIELVVDGQSAEADKAIVDGLYEPLLHMMRNAIDHGVEDPAARIAAGKAGRAIIAIRVQQVGGQLVIEVEDDGRGIDPVKIRHLAVERNMVAADALASLSDAEVVNLVFEPGFSTAETVSSLSGRGVGMDAVAAAMTRLGGKVSLQSQVGCGTRVELVLPVTMTMTKIITVGCGGDCFAAPLDDISETLQLSKRQIFDIRHGQAFLLRDQPVPLLKLSNLLGGRDDNVDDCKVLVVQGEHDRVGIAVDRFIDRMDVVMRPMSGLLRGAPGLAGATLLGDGRVVLVLDLKALAR